MSITESAPSYLETLVMEKKARQRRFDEAAKKLLASRLEERRAADAAADDAMVDELRKVVAEAEKPFRDLSSLFTSAWEILEGPHKKSLGAIPKIQRIVAKYYRLSVTDLVSARRTTKLILPRHIAMYLSKKLTLRSLPEIGRMFGGRDHTTVLHAVRKIEAMAEQDNDFWVRLSIMELQYREQTGVIDEAGIHAPDLAPHCPSHAGAEGREAIRDDREGSAALAS